MYCTQQDLEHHLGVAQLTQLTNDAWDENPPASVVATGASGGSLTGTNYYVITALNDKGETIQSLEVYFTAATNRKAVLTWAAVATAKSYKIYRSTTSGVYTTPSLLIQTTALTYTDAGATVLLAGASKSDNSLPDPTIVNDMIQMADNEIDGKVGCTYGVPFVVPTNCTAIPTLIKEISMDMAIYNCFMRRFSETDVPKQWIEKNKEATGENGKLQKIAELLIHLDGSPVVIAKEAEMVASDRVLDFNNEDSVTSMF